MLLHATDLSTVAILDHLGARRQECLCLLLILRHPLLQVLKHESLVLFTSIATHGCFNHAIVVLRSPI